MENLKTKIIQFVYVENQKLIIKKFNIESCAVRSQIAYNFRNDEILKTRLIQIYLKMLDKNGYWLLLSRII
jgi:hypothetical protein